jgi:quercetin 2,3-dioxygenase
MIELRPSKERGHANYGWLDTFHSFSFSDYHDPKHMGFRKLRVINEDRVAPGLGFSTHSHRDMEIITYVLEGQVKHKDSMGNETIIPAGDVQRMTAGTGVSHSEFNPSDKVALHLFQIWIFPNQNQLPPSYEQKSFSAEEKRNRFCLVASGQAENGALKIHQDVEFFIALLDSGKEIEYLPKKERYIWIQNTFGIVTINGTKLQPGDGAGISKETKLSIRSESKSEILLFDLA